MIATNAINDNNPTVMNNIISVILCDGSGDGLVVVEVIKGTSKEVKKRLINAFFCVYLFIRIMGVVMKLFKQS
jgi:hypothetical protein